MVKKKKVNIQFVCTQCGNNEKRLYAQCPSCKEYNTLVEFKESSAPEDSGQPRLTYSGSATVVQKLSEVPRTSAYTRFTLPFSEVNRVLGGGLVKNSVVLLSGPPGAGKSTLLLQILQGEFDEKPILYATGEEALDQVRNRAERLGVSSDDIHLTTSVSVKDILATADDIGACLVIVDSIQTMYLEELTASIGSVSQVRECTAALNRYAKTKNISVIIVGHVTKDGNVAGPQVLEHIVDVVAHIELMDGSQFRQFRTSKNRFGAEDEAGILRMTPSGLEEVLDPSMLFISDKDPQPGTALAVIASQARPMLVEIQALVCQTYSEYAQRAVVGLDRARSSMLLSVMQKHLGSKLHKTDVFINVLNGIRVFDPASDLAIAAAVFSSLEEVSIPKDSIFIGEISLAGEIRQVPEIEKRVNVAKRNGFQKIYISSETTLPRTIQLSTLKDLVNALKK